MKLSGKVAIITGAAGGLGRGIALCMAEEGADIVIADINMEAAKHVAEEVTTFGRKALVVDADVTKEENAKLLFDRTISTFGKLDILVNNVGAGHAEAGVLGGNLSEDDWNRMYTAGITELQESDWDRSYIANLKPGIFMCKAVIPYMRAQKSGKIINISSTAGRRGSTSRLPYSAMKSAVIILTQGIALQVARDNINVNCICPGIIYTSIHEDMAKIRMRTNPQLKEVKDPREAFERILGGIPMRREQTPEDIGRLAVFLASEDARNITGQSINVDGGSYMS
jgi:meso-butanediol dehydrogenase/(S,S)-butanediol dehydrogenase/diacetyl reductase